MAKGPRAFPGLSGPHRLKVREAGLECGVTATRGAIESFLNWVMAPAELQTWALGDPNGLVSHHLLFNKCALAMASPPGEQQPSKALCLLVSLQTTSTAPTAGRCAVGTSCT